MMQPQTNGLSRESKDKWYLQKFVSDGTISGVAWYPLSKSTSEVLEKLFHNEWAGFLKTNIPTPKASVTRYKSRR